MARKEKREIMVIVLSMFLAFLLWAYVMGEKSPEHKRVIQNVPVKIIGQDTLIPQDLALLPEQNITVNLTVSGQGLSVFNVVPEDIVVEADLTGYPPRKGKIQIAYKVVSLPPGIKLADNNTMPLVSVELDSFIEKSVPVLLSLTGNVKEGYGYLKPVTRPTEVLVSGPERYVNSVTSVVGIYEIPENTTNDLSPYIHVKAQGRDGKPVNHVEVEPGYVNVNIAVKPAKTVPIAVKTTGKISNDKVLRSIKPKVESITIIGDSKVLEKITEIQTVPVDLSKVTSTGTRDVFLNLPTGVYISGDEKSINVEINVENKISKDFSVKVSTINQLETLEYVMSQKEINIKLIGAESIINSFDVRKISAVIDLKDLDEGTHNVGVTITLAENTGVEILEYSPQKLGVTITKK